MGNPSLFSRLYFTVWTTDIGYSSLIWGLTQLYLLCATASIWYSGLRWVRVFEFEQTGYGWLLLCHFKTHLWLTLLPRTIIIELNINFSLLFCAFGSHLVPLHYEALIAKIFEYFTLNLWHSSWWSIVLDLLIIRYTRLWRHSFVLLTRSMKQPTILGRVDYECWIEPLGSLPLWSNQFIIRGGDPKIWWFLSNFN